MTRGHYLDIKEVGRFAFFSLIPIMVYYGPLALALHSKQKPLLVFLFGFLSCLLMFLWKVRVGEDGHVLCLGHDTGRRTGPGIFVMPSLFPFLRGFDIVIGWSVESPSFNHAGNTHNIHHFSDQRVPTYRVNTETSMFGAMLGQLLTNISLWFLNARDPDGKFKYYKYGGIGYIICWIIAL